MLTRVKTMLYECPEEVPFYVNSYKIHIVKPFKVASTVPLFL